MGEARNGNVKQRRSRKWLKLSKGIRKLAKAADKVGAIAARDPVGTLPVPAVTEAVTEAENAAATGAAGIAGAAVLKASTKSISKN
jgi:hypothetical protein